MFPRGIVEGPDGRAVTTGEGLHFRIPGLQRPIMYEIRTRQTEYRGERTGTKDLQTVTLDLRVLYKPDDKKLAELYRDVGPNENENGMLGYDNMVLPSIVKEVRKAVQEKQQKIVEAQGETESARLLGEKITNNPAYLNLEKIKAAKEIAATIAQSTNRVYLNADSLLLDVNSTTINA